MISLHLQGVSYAHTLAAVIFDRASLELAAPDPSEPRPMVGVVGANGAGKSTLLRLLAGELDPKDGHVVVHASVPPRLVLQDVDELTDDVRAFSWSWDGDAQRLRRRLELDPDDLDPSLGRGWAALSPGQRKRWQLAAALAERPDVLLLDEPTNHLDAAARDLVVEVLASFGGLGLIVSHDRQVLEQLTHRTVRLHRARLELHAGSYVEAEARWRGAAERQRAAHDRARREVRREQRILAEVRRDRHSAEAAPRRQRRIAGASQPDAREAGRKFTQGRAEAALARRVGQSNTRVARAEDAADSLEVARELGGEVGFRHAATGRRILAQLTGDIPHRGGQALLHEVDVALQCGQRVRIAGVNGAGKSTLLVTAQPSPGEARKLTLSRLLSSSASLLVLDEPTNHLDHRQRRRSRAQRRGAAAMNAGPPEATIHITVQRFPTAVGHPPRETTVSRPREQATTGVLPDGFRQSCWRRAAATA